MSTKHEHLSGTVDTVAARQYLSGTPDTVDTVDTVAARQYLSGTPVTQGVEAPAFDQRSYDVPEVPYTHDRGGYKPKVDLTAQAPTNNLDGTGKSIPNTTPIE